MHEDQRADFTSGDQRRSGDGFAEGGWRAQNPHILSQRNFDGCLLIGAQLADEFDRDLAAGNPLIPDINLNAILFQQIHHRIETAARQPDMLLEIFRAANNARFVPDRQTHGLGFVELGVLKSCQPDQAIGQRLSQLGFGNEKLIGEDQRQSARQRPGEFCRDRFCPLPWFSLVFFRDKRDVERMPAAGCSQEGTFQL